MENVTIMQQNIRTKFLTSNIPDIENFTKELLYPLFDYIINMSRFINKETRKLIEERHPNFFKNIKNKDGSKRGLPDLVCFKGKEIMFIEVKNENDSLNFNQINWAKEHQDYKIQVLRWINKPIDELKDERIFELNRKNIFRESKLEERINNLEDDIQKISIKYLIKIKKLEDENMEMRKRIINDPRIGI